ncbi:hypothetical protein [Peribacillus deserti]|uniref:Uncharacterized protein n=1 Tax=Peribacillus deserti TaxID=673318 RepID=A0A2N5MBT3_9BACI|nr:hypothetical protein [Peribacillus deserti]PLT31811.1 hypothetical protein CUU66_01240 [Peribacillus deserti]
MLIFSGTLTSHAEEDHTPLKLKNAVINQTEAKSGDRIVITFEVEPDYESGPMPDADINIMDGSGNIMYSMMSYMGDNKYQFAMGMGESDPMGEWSISTITFNDNAGNTSVYAGTDPLLKHTKWKFLDGKPEAEIDRDPPELKNFTLLTKSVDAAGKVEFSLDLADQNGPSSGSIIFKHTKTDSVLNESITYNKTNGRYEGSISLPEFAKNGEWKISFLLLRDRLGNEKWYRPDEYPFLKNTAFEVTGGVSDFEKPVYKSISFSKQKVHGGDKLTVFVDAVDKDSKIEEAKEPIKFTIF